MDQLAQHIESLIFTATSPIAFKELKGCLEESFDTKLKKPELEKALEQLKEKYQQEDFSFELVEIAGGFQFLTKASFHNTVGVYLKQTTKKRLSKAALETLSIIAYKQPVVKSEMEKIRGVSCDYSVQKLLEKELIAIVGRSNSPGQPLLYGTSDKFMDYFGLKGIEDLPKPKDFREPDNEIGEKAPIDENIVSSEEQAMTATVNAPPTASTEEIIEDAIIESAIEQESATETVSPTHPSASSDQITVLPTTTEDITISPSPDIVEHVTSSIVEESNKEVVPSSDVPIVTTEKIPTATEEEIAVLSNITEAIEVTPPPTVSEDVTSTIVEESDKEVAPSNNAPIAPTEKIPTAIEEEITVFPISAEDIEITPSSDVTENVPPTIVEESNKEEIPSSDESMVATEKIPTAIEEETAVEKIIPPASSLIEKESMESPDEDITDE